MADTFDNPAGVEETTLSESARQPIPLLIMALSLGAILGFVGLVSWLLQAVPLAEKDRFLSEDRKSREMKLLDLRAADSEKLGQADVPGVIRTFIDASKATKGLPLPSKAKAAPTPPPVVTIPATTPTPPAPAPKAEEPKTEPKK